MIADKTTPPFGGGVGLYHVISRKEKVFLKTKGEID